MSEQHAPSETPVATGSDVAQAPSAAEPESAPVLPGASAAEPEQSVAPAEPAPDSPAAEPAAHEELLSGTDPAQPAVPDAAKPAEPTRPIEPAPQTFQYADFALPEGVAPLDRERIGEFTGILDDAALDQQSRAQRLVDLHVAEMRRYDEATLQRQKDVFEHTQHSWREEFAADPEIGGAGARTSLVRANAAIRRFTSEDHRLGERLPAASEGETRQSDRSAFMDMLRVTGAINHPEMVRFLNRVEQALREPARAAEAAVPPRDIGRRPNGAGRVQMRDLYDHPSSQRVHGG